MVATRASFSAGDWVAMRKWCGVRPVKLEASRMRMPCFWARYSFNWAAVV